MEQIFSNIINHIHSQIPELQTIDEDLGQLDILDQEDTDSYPVIFPAVLIDIQGAQWSNMRGKNQKGTLSLRVRLAIDCYDDTHFYDPSTSAVKIKERAELLHTLHKSLQCFRPLGDGELIRTASAFFTAAHNVKVYEQTYTLALTDLIPETETAAPQNIRLFAKPSLALKTSLASRQKP